MNSNCPICLCKLTASDRSACWLEISCSHTICKSCTPRFFSSDYGDKCPLCRVPLPLDNSERLEAVRLLAEKGFAWAQCLLGSMLFQGVGAPCTAPELSRFWFEQAALQGNTVAMFNLGCMWYRGIGGNKSMSQAYSFFKHAATKGGQLRAMTLLGFMHATGQAPNRPVATETAKNSTATAQHWYRMAAERGSAVAQYNLGMINLAKCSRASDSSDEYKMLKARYLLNLSASQGYCPAAYQLGIMAIEGEGGFTKYSYDIAREWFERAAAPNGTKIENPLGHAEAAYRLGVLHYNGEGGRQNYETARFWLEHANSLVERKFVLEIQRQKKEKIPLEAALGLEGFSLLAHTRDSHCCSDFLEATDSRLYHGKACFALSMMHASGKLQGGVSLETSKRWHLRARRALSSQLAQRRAALS